MPAWHAPLWQRALALAGRLPHALLFSGPSGLGKRDFAEALAARLLCETPQADGHACGHCAACQLRLAGNHPDLLHLVPASQSEVAAEGGEAEAAPTKGKSAQILIEQVRALQESLTVTGHGARGRVVVVEPAEAMNAFTANALLKLLEEPPAGCTFLLVSSAPALLLPTIRSRCQQWAFPRPSEEQAAAWLQTNAPQGAPLLALCSGLPLAAARLAEQGASALLQRFVRDVGRLPGEEALRLAGEWEAWLKSKDALAAGFDLGMLTGWMQRWVCDLAVLRLGGRVRFFPAQETELAALSARLTVPAALSCYNELARLRRVVQHPLNARLLLEDMLLRYARVLTGARS